jgi:hypothetical protein
MDEARFEETDEIRSVKRSFDEYMGDEAVSYMDALSPYHIP